MFRVMQNLKFKFQSFVFRGCGVMSQGACVGCPSAVMTLKGGIEGRLREIWQGVSVVEAPVGSARERGQEEEETGAPIDEERVKTALSALFPAVQQMGGLISITKTSKSNSSFQNATSQEFRSTHRQSSKQHIKHCTHRIKLTQFCVALPIAEGAIAVRYKGPNAVTVRYGLEVRFTLFTSTHLGLRLGVFAVGFCINVRGSCLSDGIKRQTAWGDGLRDH